jgi:peptide/nickel transport system substrate-binding protein
MIFIRLCLAAVLAFAATSAFAGKRDNSIRFGYEQTAPNAVPYFNTLRVGVIIAPLVWDTLLYRDPLTGSYRGLLATRWRWINDTTIEVDLREGVKFQNGARFDADDVIFTLQYVSNPENKALATQNVDWIDRVEKLDQYKVRIIAKAPFPAALEYLASPIAAIFPHDYLAKVGPVGMNQNPVGTGPFRVVEYALGKYMRLEKNPDYFKDSPKSQPQVDKIEIRFIPDRQTQVAEVLSGGLDLIMNVPTDQAQQLRSVPSVQVVAGETMRIGFLQLNTLDNGPAPQSRDIRVRQAILHAINRAGIVKALVGGGARVIHSMCFPDQFGCTDADAPRYGYDPVLARKLLAEAGFPNGFDVDIYAYRDRDQVEAMIGDLRAVGIRANLRFLQVAAADEAVRTGKAPIAYRTWGSYSINDVSAMVSVFYKFEPDDINRDPEIRDLLVRGDSSVDAEVRKQAYAKALALIQQRAYALPLYSVPTTYVAAKGLKFTAYPDELPRFWEMSWK